MKSDHSWLHAVALCPQVRFVMGEGTTLRDLLELQLHRVEDEVKNIVDKAVKEMSIEKVSKRKWCTINTVLNNLTNFTASLNRRPFTKS